MGYDTPTASLTGYNTTARKAPETTVGIGSETKLEIGRQRTESETVDTNHTPRTTPKTRTTERETTRQKSTQASRIHF